MSVRVLITDVDGVLTTGGFLYDATGKLAKEFGPHDADGIKLLRNAGYDIIAITADQRGFEISKRRCDDLHILLRLVPEAERDEWVQHYHPGCVFIGDGLHDVGALKYFERSFAPADACKQARDAAKTVLETPGGHGVLLEVAIRLVGYPPVPRPLPTPPPTPKPKAPRTYLQLALEELGSVHCLQEEIHQAAYLINRHREQYQIIGIAAGRMGYALRAFIMRLAHLGFDAKMWGDPGVTRCDGRTLVITSTSSGETPTVKLLVEQAIKTTAAVFTVTASPESSIAKMSDQLLRYTSPVSAQPMKTLAEQFTFILFDALIDEIMKDGAFTADDIEANHSNLE